MKIKEYKSLKQFHTDVASRKVDYNGMRSYYPVCDDDVIVGWNVYGVGNLKFDHNKKCFINQGVNHD